MSNLLGRLDEAEMSYRDVPVCLKKGLIDARDSAMKKLGRRNSPVIDDRMVSAPVADRPAVLAEIAELERQIAAKTITIRIYGVDRATYNGWMLACPPRKGKDAGPFDPSKFFMHAAKNSGVYVDESGAEHPIEDAEWARIDKVLTDGEHDRIAEAVIHVNRTVGAVDVAPFVNASETTTDS